MKRLKILNLKTVGALIIAVCVLLLALKPEVYVKSSLTGIKLWALTVAPSLLPFFFLTALSSSIGITDKLAKATEKLTVKLFRCGGICSYAFLMSVLSGYPVGAKIISDLKTNGLISQDEATRASSFCSTSGPLFIIGSVGIGMFGDKRAGYAIFLSHILSAVICGLIFRFYGDGDVSKTARRSLINGGNVLYDAVYSSVISVAMVGGFICAFYIFADMLISLKILLPLERVLFAVFKDENISKGFTAGLIECTRGCKALSEYGVSRLSVALASSTVSFGGVSVIFQSLAFLNIAKVKTGVFIISKILQTVISFVLCLALFDLFF